MTTHQRRTAALVLAAITALGLTACGGYEPEETATRPSATASAPTPEELATDAFKAYWDVYVQLANSGAVESGAFQGIAEGGFVESDLKMLGDQADLGVVRVGDPTFSEYATTVEGDTATSLVCIDESSWGLKKDGEELPPTKVEPSPFEATITERDGVWIVTDLVYQEETPCP